MTEPTDEEIEDALKFGREEQKPKGILTWRDYDEGYKESAILSWAYDRLVKDDR